eukprot:3511267-Pyramimonas_sp.AAC.1
MPAAPLFSVSTTRPVWGWLSTHARRSGCALPTTIAGFSPSSMSVSLPLSPHAAHRPLGMEYFLRT